MLVLHLDRQFCRTEYLAVVPGNSPTSTEGVIAARILGACDDLPIVRNAVRRVAERDSPRILHQYGFLYIAYLIVVLLMENMMNRGQSDVLVRTTIPRNVMVADRLDQYIQRQRPGSPARRDGVEGGEVDQAAKAPRAAQRVVAAGIGLDSQSA